MGWTSTARRQTLSASTPPNTNLSLKSMKKEVKPQQPQLCSGSAPPGHCSTHSLRRIIRSSSSSSTNRQTPSSSSGSTNTRPNHELIWMMFYYNSLNIYYKSQIILSQLSQHYIRKK